LSEGAKTWNKGADVIGQNPGHGLVKERIQIHTDG